MKGSNEKCIDWRGSSLKDLLEFPAEARKEAGFQRGKIQQGLEPADWKPMNICGAGVKELRLTMESGAYRVITIAKFAEVIYVLHRFQKKTQQTPQKDKDIILVRYKAIINERSKK
ncbi:type II toxin-antitoxin system RelE/ParE family toxin [Candidatus Regiella endosymbiont of Tuberolachnus salignus]|uniref:type II toxin-antitoxin system RelE/ParE family toxin n=1 Tax=Candidatus Regiella endosymbiont of Tuberolachnus salignus TaxID=3077956 RepID=UPI0030D2DF4A